MAKARFVKMSYPGIVHNEIAELYENSYKVIRSLGDLKAEGRVFPLYDREGWTIEHFELTKLEKIIYAVAE